MSDSGPKSEIGRGQRHVRFGLASGPMVDIARGRNRATSGSRPIRTDAYFNRWTNCWSNVPAWRRGTGSSNGTGVPSSASFGSQQLENRHAATAFAYQPTYAANVRRSAPTSTRRRGVGDGGITRLRAANFAAGCDANVSS
jgi:hypothetical protein